MSTTVQIYGLLDPRDGALRYIGKANDAGKRLLSHMRDSGRRDRPVHRWIRKLIAAGQAPDVIVLAEPPALGWQAVERYWIARGRASNQRLLNVADGGDEPLCPRDVRAANAARLNEERRNDPWLAKAHQALRVAGTGVRWLERNGKPEAAAKLQQACEVLRQRLRQRA